MTVLFLVCVLLFPGLFPVSADTPFTPGSIGVGYYQGTCTGDTIPDILEAGREYTVTITYMNRGLVSWQYDVEKFGLLYEGLQSSIRVDPVFSPLDPGVEIPSRGDITFLLTLQPPEKPGEYTLSFSMATRKGTEYTTFPSSFSKTITVIPEGGISSPEYGSIIIESIPPKAEVKMGESVRGSTPLTLPDLNPATYQITITHPDHRPKWKEVTVEPGSVTRITVDLTTTGEMEVETEKVQRFTLLGWIISHLPLLIISITIVFLAFQVLMMNTRVIPENHPVRTFTRPITIFPPHSPDGSRRNRLRKGTGDRGSGAGGSFGSLVDESGKQGRNSRIREGTDTGKKADTNQGVRRGGDEEKTRKSDEGEKEEELRVPDEDQTPMDLENPFGFPDALKDRYEPLGIAGDDHYARVFKVMRKDTGGIRSLKVAHMKGADSEILRKEASVWGSLQHPNVVRLYKAEFNEDLTFLENEYLSGVRYKGSEHTSLSMLPKPIREKYALSLIRDIAEGIRYTHNMGIRHYHLQAGDVLLTEQLTAKISGYARGKNELGFSIPESDVMDAPALYIAPEQREEIVYGNPGKRTDIFQIGVIFYELLSGYLPYSREAYEAVHDDGQYEANRTTLIPLADLKPDLAKYDPILGKLLAWQKNERYGRVEDFLAELDTYSYGDE